MWTNLPKHDIIRIILKAEEVHIMDYITIIVDAIVAFAKNFSINDVVSAFGNINWNGVKDAILTVVEAIQKVL